MSICSWNCRGVGLPSSIRFLKDLVDQERPSFIFLCETKDSKGRLERLRRELGFDGMLSVDPQGRSEGLALMWKGKDQVNL